MRYFVNIISRSHVQAGLAGGFAQADHGQQTRLERLAKGDAVVFYSPREQIRAGETVQRFTAIAEVIDDVPYQADGDTAPWRRRVRHLDCSEAAVQPLIDRLQFIRNKASWGVAFRPGFFEIGKEDFETISAAMRDRIKA